MIDVKQSIRLVIEWTPTTINVEGPLGQETLMLGILEQAKNTVVDYNRKKKSDAEESKLYKPNMALPPPPKKQ